MKPSLFKQRIMTLAVLLFSMSLTAAAEEVSKEYHKESTPGPNSTLNITNKFGDVVTETWTENRIVVDVKVTVENSSAEKAKKIMQMIEVAFTEENGSLTAVTNFDDNFSDIHWGNDNNRFSIDYSVKMPANVNLTISNKYGNTEIDEVSGQVILDLKYGNLFAGKLNRGNVKPINSISIAYGKAEITEMSWATVSARYCNQFDIDKATAITVESKYSKFNIEEASSVVCDSKYDNYSVGKVKNFVAAGGYTSFKLESVASKLSVQTKYGNLSVESIPEGFSQMDVEASYCSVKLGISSSACYNLNAQSRYGGVKLDDDNFEPVTRIVGNNSAEIKGLVGNCKNPASSVNITASYGSVTLF